MRGDESTIGVAEVLPRSPETLEFATGDDNRDGAAPARQFHLEA